MVLILVAWAWWAWYPFDRNVVTGLKRSMGLSSLEKDRLVCAAAVARVSLLSSNLNVQVCRSCVV
jgi:hypothetical protein